jgi:rod shape determining protein RodA
MVRKRIPRGHTNQRRFVPEQHTDYIFTTVGEEWGFAGSLVVMALFAGLLLRIIYLAERQKQNSVGFMVTVLQNFIYFFVNIGFQASSLLLEFHFRFLLRRIWTLGFLLFIFYQNGCK